MTLAHTAGCTGACVRREVGNCDGDSSTFIESAEQCAAAAVALGLDDTVPNLNANGEDLMTVGGIPSNPHGCYWKEFNRGTHGASALLFFNPNGDRNDDDRRRVSICSKSAAMHLGCSI